MPEKEEELLKLKLQQISLRIMLQRQKLGWRQADLAEESGLSESYIQLLESGRANNPGIVTLMRIAWALGKPEQWLLGGE